MNITTTTKTVTEHTLVLSAEDLQRYQDDPWAFRDDVIAQLNGGGKGTVKLTKRKTAARQSGRKNGKAASPKPTRAAKAIKLLLCPHCAKTFKQQGWLNQHLFKAHPSGAATAA